MRAAAGWAAVLVGVWLGPASWARGERYAVLVGIHDYLPAGPGGPDLPGVENDLELMRQTLVRCYGFSDDPGHMRRLGGTEATRRAIRNALQEMGGRVGDDDTFVLFYSGHGAFVRDRNGDEEDGYDEVICPADGTSPDRVIVDDELGEILGQIRGHKAVILDSCFSGTGTRDLTLRTMAKSFDLPGVAAPRTARFLAAGAFVRSSLGCTGATAQYLWMLEQLTAIRLARS
ncbi:MAG: caspase domain-containing protein [Phycisphaerae bacterium]